MRAKVVLVALAAVLFPVGLALAVYATSAPSLASEFEPAGLSQTIAEPSAGAPPTTTAKKKRQPPTTTVDISGNCDEAEHANDPECTGSAGDDDSGSDSGNSGSGSSNSGSGSSGSGGDDD